MLGENSSPPPLEVFETCHLMGLAPHPPPSMLFLVCTLFRNSSQTEKLNTAKYQHMECHGVSEIVNFSSVSYNFQS